jgi:hypothetical protein
MKRRGLTTCLAGLCVSMLAFATAGCESFSDYCEAKMDCEGGNDADIEACELSLEHNSDQASLYGCEDYFDSLAECLDERAQCDSDPAEPIYTTDDCEPEQLDLSSCIAD